MRSLGLFFFYFPFFFSKYLGEDPMSMSRLKSSGLLMEAMHPIIPDIEWPIKTDARKLNSSRRAIKSSAKASYEEYLAES